MVDVFISYSRRDRQKVALIARAIEAEGYKVWWDAELPPHQSYGDVITAKIGEAKAAIVVWSGDAVQSEWVRAEADMARNQRKLIQTALDQVMPPLPFNQIQFAEIGDWNGEPDHPGWRKVLLSLADLCNREAPPPVQAYRMPEGAPAPYTPPASHALPPPVVSTDRGHSPHPQPVGHSRSNAPLFIGIAIGVIALAVAAGIVLSQRTPVAEPVATVASADPAPATPVAAEMATPAPVPSAAPLPETASAALPASDPDDEPPPVNPADMTFPDSSTRLIEPHELAQMGPATLRVARNEIYARKGRRFRDAWLRDYFSMYAWYRPRFDDVPLNPTEQRNIATIRQAEAKYQ